jgi:hypothetical protein
MGTKKLRKEDKTGESQIRRLKSKEKVGGKHIQNKKTI